MELGCVYVVFVVYVIILEGLIEGYVSVNWWSWIISSEFIGFSYFLKVYNICKGVLLKYIKFIIYRYRFLIVIISF